MCRPTRGGATSSRRLRASALYQCSARAAAVRKRLGKADRAVVPGFYGSGPDGKVRVFSRGGSDLSGSLVAVVGRGIRSRPGVAAKVCGALARKSINIRMIDQGASRLNIILGVDSRNYEAAVRALYSALIS